MEHLSVATVICVLIIKQCFSLGFQFLFPSVSQTRGEDIMLFVSFCAEQLASHWNNENTENKCNYSTKVSFRRSSTA